MTTPRSWEHYLVGVSGLAMLRSWDLGDKRACERWLAELATMTTGRNGTRNGTAVAEVGVREGYDAWAASYESAPNGLMTLSDTTVTQLLAGLVPATAVDVGCGAGRGLRRLAAAGHHVVGVDLSPGMLAKARQEFAAGLVAGDLTALPLGCSSVDLVTCTLALAHQPDLAAVGEFARVVRPGGHVVITDAHPVLVMLGGHALAHSGRGGMALVRNYVHSASAYLAAFAAAGLEVEAFVEPSYGPAEMAAIEVSLDLPEAVQVAFAGLPALIGWRLRRG